MGGRRHGGDIAAGVGLLAGYLLLASLPVVLAFAFKRRSEDSVLHNIGLAAGMVGFALLTLQVTLSARVRPVDRRFGLDAVMHFHKGMAILAVVLVAAHPILFSIDSGSLALFGTGTEWQVDIAKGALLILLGTVAFGLGFRRVRMDYVVWRALHKIVLVAVALVFVHSWLIGPDLKLTSLRIYWVALFGIALGTFFFRNLALPRLRPLFRVTDVQPETHNVWTLTLAPASGRLFRYEPGQFMFLRLYRAGRHTEEHPFTISSSPTRRDTLTVTIKQSGDYTDTIGQTRPGDTARIEAPYGRFSPMHYHAPAFIMIAGGVGITPVMSMLRYLRDNADTRPVALIYANRTEADIVFRDELAALPAHVKTVHVLSRPGPDWTGPGGHVTADLIREHAADLLSEGHVFFCGPGPMLETVLAALRELGVDRRRIHYERFSL